jgi:hypothetical protein
MPLKTYLRLAALALPLLPVLLAQSPRLTVSDPPALTLKHGAAGDVKITATLNEGFHANSHTPSDENLIPLKLTWEPGPVVAKDVIYPKPKMEKYAFSPDPLSVVSGSFDITTKFALAPGAASGMSVLTGKLRYQACSDRACFPPKTVEIKLPVNIQ